ncbi:MAG: hypothetical protein ABI203_02800 [Mucilaginibacter sp.]
MTSFEIIIWIYNLSLYLVVTPLDANFCHFKVETANIGSGILILKYLPDRSWITEKTTMKFFTKAYTHKLGKLIEVKRPEWF